ncbi:MAG: Ig-like domain-containing protein [Cytophagales bacterium]|nr:Ig-like domain-containing protein [Cytophagales bacterium]
MIKYFFHLCFVIATYSILSSCANITPPTGGPRDTIPPVRILTTPHDKSTNFKGTTITMEFDERIKTDKIKDQLIITPLTKSEYDYTIKKNILKLDFEDPFIDSTTYTLNFRESIQDITEGNPTKDNKFAFSTGTYIDSMSISGYVKELLTYDTLDNITVGLYRANDTINIYNGSPYYFTELKEDGSYLIENIKNGEYLLYAFSDKNKNLTLETDDEIYGFKKDTIVLDTGLVTMNVDLINLDLTEFKMMTALASGQYFDINLNKYIVDYSITSINNTHTFYTNRAKEKKSIRFYNNFQNIDSLQISFAAVDSVGSKISDTLYVKFSPSKRKKDEFKLRVLPENNQSIETFTDVKIEFNKPILHINTDSIFIQFDTTKIVQVHDSSLVWNKFRDELSFTIEIDKSKADTILNRRKRYQQQVKDSIRTEAEETQLKQQISKSKKEEGPKLNTGLQLYFGHGAFQSADLDTSAASGYNYKFIVPEENGIQEINVNTQYENFTIQLTSENYEVVKETSNRKSIVFKNIKPGTYKIRALIDANNDGKWSPGNMLKQIEPEPVYIYPEVLVIRADWRTTLDITF